ncbi:histidine phosphatase family protein [Halalkalibacter krulwichiae]|uniref:Alpha-ribazole phosphatase n=1 Tax=Halalkalibacter krulwichiae TaxID=199441 RepID=A0A1X9MC82_9BACI|nr:histidine phosphatase family protein [Halalkalibacter krulwichiae]ARK30254.1 Alpha-ribazole phosphatase [Halalkalibacter krulwichiae]
MGNRLVVTLIRHGLTKFNEEKRYLGWKNQPLSKKGNEELLQLTHKYRNHTGDILLTSDLVRCIETAKLLFPNQPIVTSSKLREYDFGEWEGKTYEQLKETKLYRDWLDDPLSNFPPKGEAYHSFQRRTEEAFYDMVELAHKRKSKHVVVVCHGGVIRQWLSSYSPVNKSKSFFEWNVTINSCYQMIGSIDKIRRGLTFTSLQEEPITAKINGH